MRFWTGKFIAALAASIILVVDACWYHPDPISGKPRHLLPVMDTGVASFIGQFALLFLFLYVVSHAGGWLLGKFRHRGGPEPEQDRKTRRKSGRRK